MIEENALKEAKPQEATPQKILRRDCKLSLQPPPSAGPELSSISSP